MLQALTLLVIALFVGVDQLTKYFALTYLKPKGSAPFLSGFLQLRYVENTGAAFGSLSNRTALLSVVTFVVIAVGLYLLLRKKIKPGLLYVGVVLILAGGIGNLLDRVFRGFVVDFIEPLFVDFAVFNVADCFVTVGAGLFIAYMIYDLVRDVRRERAEKEKAVAGEKPV